MTVWVDNFRAPATIGKVRGRWSHLTASTPAELHEMADRLGLRRSWFQARCKLSAICPVVDGVCPHFHYDVVDAKRAAAIAAGAMDIDIRVMGAITSARRKQFRSLIGTRPVVLGDGVEQGWADPIVDPTEITDWPVRQQRALVRFEVVDGRPVNPVEPGLPYGRNELGHWGEQACADMAVFVQVNGAMYLLLIKRGDGHGWGLPGGTVDKGENEIDAAFRECREETGLALTRSDRIRQTVVLQPRYVPDPRASREAWMCTVPVIADLGVRDQFPAVEGDDDAAEARWFLADDYQTVVGEVTDLGGSVFRAHESMLSEIMTGWWARDDD